jgi:predicted dehydrogenase
LNDKDTDLVLVATRHDLHGSMTLEALRAGKHVFVEKPLTIFPNELDEIESFYRQNTTAPVLMVGFNRRFAPPIQTLQQQLAKRTTPLIVNYRMNAGFIAGDHWVHSREGGGRNLGEACHIYDLFAALTGASPVVVQATAITPSGKQWHKNDNFVAMITYSDGSVCTLTYTALGTKAYPKERMEVFADGKVFSLDDYKSLTVAGGKGKAWTSMTQEKGQQQELQCLADCLLKGTAWPISLQQQLETTRVAFEVERQIVQSGSQE